MVQKIISFKYPFLLFGISCDISHKILVLITTNLVPEQLLQTRGVSIAFRNLMYLSRSINLHTQLPELGLIYDTDLHTCLERQKPH